MINKLTNILKPTQPCPKQRC